MKILSPPKFLLYATFRAIRYPRTPISYYWCNACKVRFADSLTACPKCGEKVGHSPDPKQNSPVPWWGSVMVIMLGIICWIMGAGLDITGLNEVGRAMIYIPLGNLFGLSLRS